MILELFLTHIAPALLAFTPGPPLALSDTVPPWRDPSPHQVTHVQVSSTVQLELLDWGGRAGGRNRWTCVGPRLPRSRSMLYPALPK
jgi:hypothetical protein